MQHRLNILILRLILSLCLFLILTDADCFGNIHERGSNENNVLSQFGINVGFGSSSSSGAPTVKPITLVEQGFVTYSTRQWMGTTTHTIYYLVFDDNVNAGFDTISWRFQSRIYAFDTASINDLFIQKPGSNVICFHYQGSITGGINSTTSIEYQNTSSTLGFNFYDISHIRPVDITDLKRSYTGADVQQLTAAIGGIFDGSKLNGTIKVILTNNINNSTKSISIRGGAIFNDFYNGISDEPFFQIEGYECLGIQDHPTTLPMFSDITFEVKFRPLTPPTE